MKQAILEQLLADREAQKPVVLATAMETGEARLIYPAPDGQDPLNRAAAVALIEDKSRLVDSDQGQCFLHAFNPPLRMLVIGAVHIAQPLAQMAAVTGYDVTIIDPRGAFVSEERFPGLTVSAEWPDEALIKLGLDHRTAVVTLTHDPKIDDPALHIALRAPVFYIGCLGSNRTHGLRIERLAADGFTEAEIGRIHGPIGLDIAAKSPAEIAVAILAEVTQALRRQGAAA